MTWSSRMTTMILKAWRRSPTIRAVFIRLWRKAKGPGGGEKQDQANCGADGSSSHGVSQMRCGMQHPTYGALYLAEGNCSVNSPNCTIALVSSSRLCGDS